MSDPKSKLESDLTSSTEELPSTAALLMAGGLSTRMGGDLPKPFVFLCGKRVILYSLELFYSLPYICEVVVVCALPFREEIPAPPAGKVLSFADPGVRRQDSVYNGLSALVTSPTLVLTHDSARPLVDADIVGRAVTAAHLGGAAIAAVPVKPTIKIADTRGTVCQTPPRHLLWEAQTPQVVRRDLLATAFTHPNNVGVEVTDDAMLVENMGLPVTLTMGSYANLKITTPDDLVVLACLLSR